MTKKKYYPKKNKGLREEGTHLAICNYIRLSYPDVIFFSDGSGVVKSKALAGKLKALKSSRGIPDLFLAEPRGGYGGMFLEIKREGETVFKQDGSLIADEHVKRQAGVLDRLMHKGYASYFCIGLTMGINLIDEYMAGAVEPREEN